MNKICDRHEDRMSGLSREYPGSMISQDGDLLNLSMDALNHFGIAHQFGMMQEECAELIQAISKHKRNIIDRENLKEELADVFIVWHQIAISLGVRDIEIKILEKMVRLHSLIKNKIPMSGAE